MTVMNVFSIIQALCFYFKYTVLMKTDSLLEILCTGTGHLWREKNCKSFPQLPSFAGWKESGVCKTGSCKCRVLCVSISYVSLCIPVRTWYFEETNNLLDTCSQSWSVCAVCAACPFLSLVNQTYHSHLPPICPSSAGSSSLAAWGLPVLVSGMRKAMVLKSQGLPKLQDLVHDSMICFWIWITCHWGKFHKHELRANGANFTNGEYNSTLKQKAGRGKERNDIYSAVLGLSSAWGKRKEDC